MLRKYWVKEIRELAGLSIEELGELTGFSALTIKSYDSGNNTVTRGYLPSKLVECLGVDPDWMNAMLEHEKRQIEHWRRRVTIDFHTPIPRPSKITGNPFLCGHPVIRKFIEPAPGTKIYKTLKGNAERASHAPETDCPPARLSLPSRFNRAFRMGLKAWKSKEAK